MAADLEMADVKTHTAGLLLARSVALLPSPAATQNYTMAVSNITSTEATLTVKFWDGNPPAEQWYYRGYSGGTTVTRVAGIQAPAVVEAGAPTPSPCRPSPAWAQPSWPGCWRWRASCGGAAAGPYGAADPEVSGAASSPPSSSAAQGRYAA